MASTCAECGATNQDSNVVRERFDTELCDWCALSKGDYSFIRKRAGKTLLDREVLVTRIQLVPGTDFLPWEHLKSIPGCDLAVGHAEDFEWDTKIETIGKDCIRECTGVVIE